MFSNHQEMLAQPLGPAHRSVSVLTLPLGEVFTISLVLGEFNSPRKLLLPPGTQRCPLTGPVGAGSTEGSPVLKMKIPLLGHCGPGICWKVSRGWGPCEALR